MLRKDHCYGKGEKARRWLVNSSMFIGVLAGLWLFLVGLEIFADSVKCLGGRGAATLFLNINNPIEGLMVGILATVLVQSSSTTTSIVVTLVGAATMSVKTGIPIIMGANIGTAVTNSAVSVEQAGDRIALQRAFSGATIHGTFNLLTVLVLFPLEIIVSAIDGQGGPLYWICKCLADIAMQNGGGPKDDPFNNKSPTKLISAPFALAVLANDKAVIEALSLGVPVPRTATWANVSQGCAPLGVRRLHGEGLDFEEEGGRALLNRRLQGVDCSRFYCVLSQLDKNFKKINGTAYKKLVKCSHYVSDSDTKQCRSTDKCYLNAGSYYQKYVTRRQILNGGWVQGGGDVGGGILALVVSLVLMGGGLVCLSKCMKVLMSGTARKCIVKATKANDYLAIVVGTVMTAIVQSSGTVTSVIVPLAGIGVLPLTKMLPLTLGANIGTCITAIITALASFTRDSIQIALCHLLFNIIGVLIWFPAPPMRRVLLRAAWLWGLYAAHYRLFPVIYTLSVFLFVPGMLLGLSLLCKANIVGGVCLAIVLSIAYIAFQVWWCRGGCYKVLSKAAREDRQANLDQANAQIAGEWKTDQTQDAV